jgi:hypothetical protein
MSFFPYQGGRGLCDSECGPAPNVGTVASEAFSLLHQLAFNILIAGGICQFKEKEKKEKKK